MTEPTRRERIRSILIAEFRGDGHELFEHEGETYARLVENTKRGAPWCWPSSTSTRWPARSTGGLDDRDLLERW